jgi:hypothetical protein
MFTHRKKTSTGWSKLSAKCFDKIAFETWFGRRRNSDERGLGIDSGKRKTAVRELFGRRDIATEKPGRDTGLDEMVART